MQLKTIGPKVREIIFQDGARVLFSYSTPVAAMVPGKGYVKSDTFYSQTTNKHIKQWLNGATVKNVTQESLNELIKEGY